MVTKDDVIRMLKEEDRLALQSELEAVKFFEKLAAEYLFKNKKIHELSREIANEHTREASKLRKNRGNYQAYFGQDTGAPGKPRVALWDPSPGRSNEGDPKREDQLDSSEDIGGEDLPSDATSFEFGFNRQDGGVCEP